MAKPDFDIGLYYKITRSDNGDNIQPLRDASPPVLVSVGARWSVIERPRRVSYTQWAGDDPFRMDLPILLDGWDKLESVEPDIIFLNGARRATHDYTAPPLVYVEGAVPVKGNKWIIEGIDFGDNVIWHEDGYRVRQDAVIHLLDYVPLDQLSIKPPSTTHKHTVKAGETLKSISRDEYGSVKYWSFIKNANNIRDVKKLPKTLTIPALPSI